MAWTTLGTVAPGDVLRANSGTAAYNSVVGNLNIAPHGYVISAEITSDSSVFTGSVVNITGLSISVPQVSGRYYLTLVRYEVVSTVSGDQILMTLTDGSNNALSRSVHNIAANGAAVSGQFIFYEKAGSTATVTRKVRAIRNSGTGDCKVQAAATYPSQIICLDLGA